MSGRIDWKSEAKKEIAKRTCVFLCLALMFGLASLVADFRSNLSFYDRALLIVVIAHWLIFLGFNVFVFLRDLRLLTFSLIGHGVFVLTVVGLTIWSNQQTLITNVPLYIGLFVLASTQILQQIYFNHRFITDTKRSAKVGFATTGIVIGSPSSAHPYFTLVLNTNLRGGKGLWVPPGGHFYPQFETPVEKLREKVRAEIGVNCEIYSPYTPLEIKNNESRVEGGEWITPPTFVLKEDLRGLCSHFHTFHIDFLYLCLTDGAIVELNHKYQNDQIRVPLEHCAASFEKTENAIGTCIDQWYVERTGRKPGTRDDLTKDVVWRIFLAAKIFKDTWGR